MSTIIPAFPGWRVIIRDKGSVHTCHVIAWLYDPQFKCLDAFIVRKDRVERLLGCDVIAFIAPGGGEEDPAKAIERERIRQQFYDMLMPFRPAGALVRPVNEIAEFAASQNMTVDDFEAWARRAVARKWDGELILPPKAIEMLKAWLAAREQQCREASPALSDTGSA